MCGPVLDAYVSWWETRSPFGWGRVPLASVLSQRSFLRAERIT